MKPSDYIEKVLNPLIISTDNTDYQIQQLQRYVRAIVDYLDEEWSKNNSSTNTE